jgi:hypothetical protein
MLILVLYFVFHVPYVALRKGNHHCYKKMEKVSTRIGLRLNEKQVCFNKIVLLLL